VVKLIIIENGITSLRSYGSNIVMMVIIFQIFKVAVCFAICLNWVYGDYLSLVSNLCDDVHGTALLYIKFVHRKCTTQQVSVIMSNSYIYATVRLTCHYLFTLFGIKRNQIHHYVVSLQTLSLALQHYWISLNLLV